MEVPKKIRANSYDTGIASEYLILSLLYRAGAEAYISLGNKKSIDIKVIKSDGTSISVDVKSVRDYSSLVVNNVNISENHIIVFVIYKKQFKVLNTMPDIYIVPSYALSEPKVITAFKNEKRVMKQNIKNYKDRWDYIVENYTLI